MVDMETLELQVKAYIEKNFELESEPTDEVDTADEFNFTDKIKFPEIKMPAFLREYLGAPSVLSECCSERSSDPDKINFRDMLSNETFSEMLWQLIKQSGEKNSTIYNRANIDRRHFSKILNNTYYNPSKQTVLTFAIALRLDIEKTKALLATAGFSLTKSNLTDLIVSYFIEDKNYDVDSINRILQKYEQPLLGSTENRKSKTDLFAPNRDWLKPKK